MAVGKPDMKILVVDDFPTMRRIVKTLLKQIGFENTIEAEDGVMALKVLESDPKIEFVMSDWNMPNMTGIDLLRAVRAHPKLKTMPFVLVTAEAEKENIVVAVKAGVNNYIVKPFTAEALREKLDKVFNALLKKAS